MTEKEFKKLTRADLLEMLIEQQKQMEALQEKLAAAEAKLASREIVLDNAGSIAEASLQLNGIFEAAQAACEQYTENIRALSERQTEVCRKIQSESEENAAKLIADAESKAMLLELEGKRKYTEMVAQAETESKEYWQSVSTRLEAFYAEHAGLRQLLSSIDPALDSGK